ncbi:sugar kinase [Aquimarina megaterium]|uniref:sugar kinase n=1 Tax=Aquimarina megaterium TaxID=1443666 RepID=UPI00046E69B9|nr:sugar kinase [Aquimarina megaterium]
MEVNKTILTFGEILLRFSAPNHQKLTQIKTFDVHIGGAEANVAVSLALLNNKVKYLSRLPNNDIGDLIIKELKSYQVNTDLIIRGGDRTGTYYLEKGASVRSSKVVYDRKHSAFSEITSAMFDWGQIFENVHWLHVTGITPALSYSCQKVYIEMLKIAKSMDVTISFDINYRRSLWSIKEARKIIDTTLKYTDVLFMNRGVAEEVFGIKTSTENVDAIDVFSEITKKLTSFCNPKHIAYTNRDVESASNNNWQGVLFENNKGVCSKNYTIDIIDRIGAGDAFAAGIIHGLINQYDNQKTIDFATAASALKHTIIGDFNLVNKDEIMELMYNSAPGYVKR